MAATTNAKAPTPAATPVSTGRDSLPEKEPARDAPPESPPLVADPVTVWRASATHRSRPRAPPVHDQPGNGRGRKNPAPNRSASRPPVCLLTAEAPGHLHQEVRPCQAGEPEAELGASLGGGRDGANLEKATDAGEGRPIGVVHRLRRPVGGAERRCAGLGTRRSRSRCRADLRAVWRHGGVRLRSWARPRGTGLLRGAAAWAGVRLHGHRSAEPVLEQSHRRLPGGERSRGPSAWSAGRSRPASSEGETAEQTHPAHSAAPRAEERGDVPWRHAGSRP